LYFPEEKPDISVSDLVDSLSLPKSDGGVGAPKRKAVNIKGLDPKWSDEEIFKRTM